LSTVFTADKDTTALAHSVRDEYHPHLKNIDAMVLFSMARIDDRTGETAGPALRAYGAPTPGIAKICNPQERAITKKEILLKIDAAEWDAMTPDQRVALLDHLWSHIELVRDSQGRPRYGTDGRIRLTKRQHDWRIGGFNSVLERHGEAAIDVLNIKEAFGEDSQLKTALRQLHLFA